MSQRDSVIELRGLCKSYRNVEILHDFNFKIKKGHICGLLGPNGVGKTTIIKILAGLTPHTKGEILLFNSNKNINKSRQRMSFMIEEPIVNYQMTAYENLKYIQYLRNYPDDKRIDEILDIIELADTNKLKVGNFSLGMRQRLGIGMALLPKPEILILDEPVNGLDAEGIVKIRHLLKRLAEESNITILISSHILSELAELCTDFIIMNKGTLIESLDSEKLFERCKNYLVVQTDDIPHTAAILEDKLSIKNYKVINGSEIQIFEQLDRIKHISKTITDNYLVITKLYANNQSLEEYYLEKVSAEIE